MFSTRAYGGHSPNLGAPRKPQGARVRLLSMTLYGGPSLLLTEKSTFIEFSFLCVDMECYPCFDLQSINSYSLSKPNFSWPYFSPISTQRKITQGILKGELVWWQWLDKNGFSNDILSASNSSTDQEFLWFLAQTPRWTSNTLKVKTRGRTKTFYVLQLQLFSQRTSYVITAIKTFHLLHTTFYTLRSFFISPKFNIFGCITNLDMFCPRKTFS